MAYAGLISRLTRLFISIQTLTYETYKNMDLFACHVVPVLMWSTRARKRRSKYAPSERVLGNISNPERTDAWLGCS